MGFVKIFALGHRIIKTIFDDDVEVTEKVDGSQFSFGLINGEIICNSKRARLIVDHPEDQFVPAITTVKSIADKLKPNWLYFGETLKTPRHNVIKYERVPTGHIAIFGILDTEAQEYKPWEWMLLEAERLNIDVVPRLFQGKTNYEKIKELIHTISFLGGANIEGVVVKNYSKPTMIGDVVFPFMCGKLVAESFKEKHSSQAYGNAAKKDGWESFCESFRHENRWRKAVRHLVDDGTLLGEPKDIGPLVKEIQRDIVEEEMHDILEFLWKHHSPHLLRRSIQGFPEWYKEQLATGEIDRIKEGGADVEEDSCGNSGACMLSDTD
jgi:hypothetical protein